MKKGIISIVCAIACSFTLFPNCIYATEYEQNGDFMYKQGTNIVTKYVGTSSEIVFPENTEISSSFQFGEIVLDDDGDRQLENPITKITISKNVEYRGESLSRDRYNYLNIEEVTFADGVEDIPDYAFSGFSSIDKINFPDTLKRIGKYAFANTDDYSAPSVTELNLPDSVVEIGEGAFNGCKSLKKLHLPESLGNRLSAFSEVHLESLELPKKYCEADYGYGFCIDADEYIFDDMTPAIYKMLMRKDWTQNKYLKGLTDKNMGKYDDFVIIDNVLLKYIGDDKKPIVPNEVKEICRRAFANCDIETVTLPERIKTISAQMFDGSSLEYITIPSTVETIESSAFNKTKLRSLVIPKNVKEIEQMGICPILTEVTFEGAPNIKSIPFQDTAISNKESIHFLDSSIVLPSDFWEVDWWGGELVQSTVKPTTEPTQTPSSTIEPKATANPTTEPNATAKPTTEPTQNTAAPTQAPKGTIAVSSNVGEIAVAVETGNVSFPDAKPFVDEADRTQIPIRALSEMLNFEVSWNAEDSTATLTKGDDVITIKIGESTITKNNESIQMDTEAKVINDRTYVPLRFIAEALGYEVAWEH